MEHRIQPGRLPISPIRFVPCSIAKEVGLLTSTQQTGREEFVRHDQPKITRIMLYHLELVVAVVACLSPSGSSQEVTFLPGLQNDIGFKQYAGSVVVNETHGRSLFYWSDSCLRSVLLLLFEESLVQVCRVSKGPI